MTADLQAHSGNVKLSLNSHRGFEQLDTSCILDQLERNGVDYMPADVSGEPPGVCMCDVVASRAAKDHLFTVMRHHRSVLLAKAKERAAMHHRCDD